jgi:hypothetical protein
VVIFGGLHGEAGGPCDLLDVLVMPTDGQWAWTPATAVKGRTPVSKIQAKRPRREGHWLTLNRALMLIM